MGNTVLIFGGRDFQDVNLMCQKLNEFINCFGYIETIVHGGAKGADSIAGDLGVNWLRCNVKCYPADWKNIDVEGAVVKYNSYGPYNAVAGHQRNQRMIDDNVLNWGIGFPGGSGTNDMFKRLQKHEVPVWMING